MVDSIKNMVNYEISKCIPRVWNSNFLDGSTLFFSIMPYGSHFSSYKKWPSLLELNIHTPQPLFTWHGLPAHFVWQRGMREKVSLQTLYEPRIFLFGEIKTRSENWHDFFNAIIWYSFPKIKAALNMRQFIAFDENAEFPWKKAQLARIPEQDLMAIFDEGGSIIVCVENGIKIPFLFGHGAYERIAYGDKDISTCAVNLKVKENFLNLSLKEQLSFIDKALSSKLCHRSFYTHENNFYSLSRESMCQLIIKNSPKY